MENAADALKMAAAVLIFVVALSISINAFGQARQTSQLILDYKDREYNYTYINDNGNYSGGKTERIVSAETIIPSIYKAYKENYKIVFKFKTGDDYLYNKLKNGIKTPRYAIDLQNDVVGTEEKKEKFLDILIYGANRIISNETEKNKFSIANEIDLQFTPIYDRINIGSGKTFTEKIGVYYQEEIYKSDSPDANKTKKRVVTYIEN